VSIDDLTGLMPGWLAKKPAIGDGERTFIGMMFTSASGPKQTSAPSRSLVSAQTEIYWFARSAAAVAMYFEGSRVLTTADTMVAAGGG
jgi:hypothetical protein